MEYDKNICPVVGVEGFVSAGKQFDVDIQFLTFNRIDISSQEIRKRVRTGRSIKYMVPKECIEFICLKGLYK